MLLLKIYRKIIKEFNFFLSVNWIKTVYFNFKMLPFNQAKKLPFYFYGKVCFSNLTGKVVIDSVVKRGLVNFGYKFEVTTKPKGIAKIHIEGELVFKGHVTVGHDYLLYVGKDGYCEFNDMSGLGSDVKLICKQSVILGKWTGIAYESQIIDTNSHPMMNTQNNSYYKSTGSIQLGSYNAISNRVSILPNTMTPNNCVVASNSLLNKDYRDLGEEVLIGGMPAKLLKNHFKRDWEGQKTDLIKWRGIKL